MLHAVGYTRDDLSKPIIGIANTWTENRSLQLSPAHARGVCEAGHSRSRRHANGVQHGHHFRWHHHGHAGHESIARQPRSDRRFCRVGRAWKSFLDGLVAIAGCDKNMPGTVMALARLDIPSLMLYGGSIAPGKSRRQRPEHSRCVRSDWQALARRLVRRRPACSGREGVSRGGRLRRPVHGEHHGHGLRISWHLADWYLRRSGTGGRESSRNAAKPAAW